MASLIILLSFVLRKKIQKFEYLENERSFLDEIKNILHSFFSEGLSFGEKIKN